MLFINQNHSYNTTVASDLYEENNVVFLSFSNAKPISECNMAFKIYVNPHVPIYGTIDSIRNFLVQTNLTKT